MSQDNSSFWVEIKKFEETLAKDPNSYCFAPLAELYRKLKLYDDAITVAKKGCDLHPNYVGGYLSLGRAYFDKGMKQESRDALEKVVLVTPDNILAQKMLSQIYAEAGEIVAAEKTLQTILSLYPDDTECKGMLDSLHHSPEPASPSVSSEDAPGMPATGSVDLAADSSAAADDMDEEFILDDVDVIEELEPLEEDSEDDVDIPAMLYADELETGSSDIAIEPITSSQAEISIPEPQPSATAPQPWGEAAGITEPEGESFSFEEDIEVEAEEFALTETTSDQQFLASEEMVIAAEPDPFEFEGGDSKGVVETPFPSTPDIQMQPEKVSLPVNELQFGADGFPLVGKDPMATATVAELYIQQGFLKRALKIYRDLVEANPNDEELRTRLIELKHSIDTDESIARDHALDSNYRVAATDEGNVANIGTPVVAPQMVKSDDTPTVLETLDGWLANIKRRR